MDSTEDRLDKLEAMVTDLFRQMRGLRLSRNDGLATLNKGIDDLRQRIEGKFAKMAEEHALDVVATDARMDRLSGIINEHEGRLDATDTWRNQTTARLDRFFVSAEHALCGNTECGQCYPKPRKPTIRGGWINIWRTSYDRNRVMGPIMFETREDADRQARLDSGIRIACIRIPDFQEGEGL